jgi:hypothetical protein
MWAKTFEQECRAEAGRTRARKEDTMPDERPAGQEGGFLRQLFDFSFTRFITTRIVRVLFVLGLFFGFVGTVGAIVGGFYDSVTVGVVTLVLSPLWLLLYAIVIRVLLEMAIIIFRMAENVGEIAKQGRTGS